MEKIVLYIHGMGGGGDSRIPSILRDYFARPITQLPSAEAEANVEPRSEGSSIERAKVKVVVRTYDFDPEVAARQIAGWVEELKPNLIIGESLGSLQAIRIKGIPHLFVSPSLNAPLYLGNLAWLALIPRVTWLFDRIYKPKEGDRQRLHFTFSTLKKYRRHRREALKNTTRSGSEDYFFAFFGTHDHYRRSGVVSIRTWEKYFGQTWQMYEGTHFMEEEHINALLVPKICELLKVSR